MQRLSIKINEAVSVGCTGGVIYSIIEILWRGHTHWTMAVTGGICLMLLYTLNKRLLNSKIAVKCLLGAVIITAVELYVGYIVNIKLKWNVWDYSDRSFNVFGQICPLYSILWFFICLPAYKICSILNKRQNFLYDDNRR